MLSIGAAVLGASYVLAVDIDEGALDLCQQNLADLDCSTVCKGTLSSGPNAMGSPGLAFTTRVHPGQSVQGISVQACPCAAFWM